MKAKEGGKLESSKEQKVEVKTVENKTVVEIQPANPQVIYVPSYNPTVVYGPPVYAYPPVYYPPPGAYVATAAISFGVGVAMGAFWSGCCGGGGWGWGCHWEGGHNTININNNFQNRYGYSNISGGNRVAAGTRTTQWQHNPSHRQSVPYGNRATAQRYGGSALTTSGVQRFDRSGQARTNPGQVDRGGVNRGSQMSTRDAGASRDRAQAGARDMSASQDRVGNRTFDSGNPGSQRSAFGGADSRARTQAASDRGFASSRESRSGGGGSGGGRAGGGGGRSFGGGRGGGRRR